MRARIAGGPGQPSVLRRCIARLRTGPASEAGFSLPELIVAVAVLAVLLTVVATLFTTFGQRFTENRAGNDSANVAAVGMNEITKVIRAGTTVNRVAGNLPVFVEVGDESVLFYSYLADDAFLDDNSIGAAPIMVRLFVDSHRQLIEHRWNATRNASKEWIFPSALPTTTASKRVVSRKIVAPTAAQQAMGAKFLFSYLGEDGNEIATPSTNLTTLATISAVKVTLTVQADETNRAAPVQLQNRVGLPNRASSRLGANG